MGVGGNVELMDGGEEGGGGVREEGREQGKESLFCLDLMCESAFTLY